MNSSLHRLPPELDAQISQVEMQCRQQRWLRCLTRFALISLALVVAFTGVLALGERFGVAYGAILTSFGLVEMVAVWFVLWRPMRRPITRAQIALFIEEHHPELESRLVTAVEFGEGTVPAPSDWLVDRMLEDSRDFTRSHGFSDLVEPESVIRLFLTASLFLAICMGVVLISHRLWIPFGFSAGGARSGVVSSSRFVVEPGNTRIRVGDGVVISVKSSIVGRTARLRWRSAGGEWQTAEMKQGASEGIHYYQFVDLKVDTSYQVRLARLKSEEFLIETWIPPEVASVDLTYHYPDYLGLPDREVPNSGDITAVEGSSVELSVQTNKPVSSVSMALGEGGSIPLVRSSDLLWTSNYRIHKKDSYVLELVDLDGNASEFNPKYEITPQFDRPPNVKIKFPRGDNEVNALEEFPFEFELTDDFGLADYGIQYEVVGKSEALRVSVKSEGGDLTKAEGQFELLLEELDLEPGDVITWTVWARDRKPGREEFEEISDPFFIEIRPFERQYVKAVSNQGGMGGGGGGGDEPAVVQKEILIATWNLRRKSKELAPDEFETRRSTIIESQAGLIDRLEEMRAMDPSRGAEIDAISTEMVRSLEELRDADLPAPGDGLAAAASRQQLAYRLILKMTPNQTDVQQSRGMGGGARPDLNELELDRNENFYEEENRTREEQEAAADTLDKIKELARRQEMINDEIATLISELQSATDEAERERLRRRLERLKEEEQNLLENIDDLERELDSSNMESGRARETKRALEEVREQMNRSLENLRNENLQEARSAGARALSSLDDIEQSLSNLSRSAGAERMEDLQKRFENIERMQREVIDDVTKAKQAQDAPGASSKRAEAERKRQIVESKRAVEEEFIKVIEDAASLADTSAETQELMSRRLGDWLRETSREGIVEDIKTGERLVNYGIWDAALGNEERIELKLKLAREGLDEVARSMIADDLDGMQKALAELESLLGQSASDRASERAAQTEGTDTASASKSGESESKTKDAMPGGGAPGEGKSGEAREGAEPGESETEGPNPGQGDTSDSEEAGPGPDGERSESSHPGEGQSPGQGQGPSESRNEAGEPGARGTPSGETRRAAVPGSADGEQEGQGGGDGDGEPQRSIEVAGNGPGGAGRSGRGRADRRVGADFRSPSEMRQFVESDYQLWLEKLRDAEALLPEGSPYREQIEMVREEIEMMRRGFRRRGLEPRFELFLAEVINPLTEAADRLDLEIRRQLGEKEFIITDEGAIPSKYRKLVAEYFRALADSESVQ